VSEARFVFLLQEDVVAAGGLDVAATIDVVEEALRLHSVGDTRLPSKSNLMWSDDLGSEERKAASWRCRPTWVDLFTTPVGLGTELSLWESPIRV
jgi:hypothetical protein